MILRLQRLLGGQGLAAGTAWMLAAQGVRVLAQAIYYVLLARRLGVEGYGAFVGAAALVAVATPFASLGAGSLLIRGVTRGEATPSYWWERAVNTVARWGVLQTAVVVLLGWAVLPPSVPVWLLGVVAVSDVLLLSFVEVSGQAFQALGNLKRTAQVHALWSGLKVIAALVITLLPGDGLLLWAVAYPISTALTAAACVVAVSREVGRPRRAAGFSWRELREGILFALSGGARSVYDDIDKTLLARLGTLEATGLYGAAYRIIDVAFLPVRALLFASYAGFFAQGAAGVGAAARMARRLVPPAAAYAAVAALALVLLAPAVPWLLGPEYRNVVEVIRWLAVIPVLRALHYFAADALTGSGHQGWRTAVQLTVAGFNVVLNVVLIPRFSWRGAVWASIASDAALALALWAVLGALAFRASAPNPVIGPLAPERT